MEYFFYMIDLEIMESIKKLKENQTNEEELLIEIKTNGEYLATYSEKKYCELIANLGEKNAALINGEFIDLVELKSIYDNVKADFDKEIIREFKIMIYNAISNCKGIIILKMQTTNEEIKPAKKWFEIWKK